MTKRIYSLIPDGPNTWVDVFCGSGIVTLKKPRHAREVMNDLNDEVTNLFEVLRSGQAEKLLSMVEMTPFAQQELTARYESETPTDPIEKAWAFLIESWFGRGGDCHKTGFRWSKGSTVAPEIAWARLPERLTACAERLRGVCIRKDDAFKIIDDYDTPECILFVDPPYPGKVGLRYKVKMPDQRQIDLANRLKECDAKVILTMGVDTVYDEILSDWIRHDVSVVTCASTTKPEVIFTNFNPDDFDHGPLFGPGTDISQVSTTQT